MRQKPTKEDYDKAMDWIHEHGEKASGTLMMNAMHVVEDWLYKQYKEDYPE